MEVMTNSNNVLLRLVIKLLVLDLFNGGSSSTYGTYFVFSHLMASEEVAKGGVSVLPQSTIADARDIDALLIQLRSELAKDSSSASNSYAYCTGEENCTGPQYCDQESHQCQCHDVEFLEGTCPTVGMMCSSCCCGRNVYCTGQFCEISEKDQISSQMILSIVMVMGVVSIVFMIYRMCYRNTLHQRLLLASREDSSRPSLSSLQVGVMARMCDRPPVYETRHNYQARSSANTSSSAITLGVDNPALEVREADNHRAADNLQSPSIYINTPPPPYKRTADVDDGRATASARSSVSQAPPPYSVAIKTAPQVEINGNSIRRGSQQQQQQQPQSLSSYKELYI